MEQPTRLSLIGEKCSILQGGNHDENRLEYVGRDPGVAAG